MTSTHANDDLFHALAARARATSDGRLVLDVIVGLTAALVIAVWRPAAWLVPACVGICAAAYGAWGIADRELGERAVRSGPRIVLLRGMRVGSIVVGVAAAVVAVLRVLGAALGTWIS
jgi:hypothetical protein